MLFATVIINSSISSVFTPLTKYYIPSEHPGSVLVPFCSYVDSLRFYISTQSYSRDSV